MFGYITPFKPDLRMREWSLYKAYYCGLCHTIRLNYGQLPRLALNYDFVTLAMFADSISGEEPIMKVSRCIASPVTKKCYCSGTKGLNIAAACQILAVYYKLFDDTTDEHGAKHAVAKAAITLLKNAHKKAALLYPKTDACLKSQTTLQAQLENEKCTNPDMAAEPTAQMTSEMFSLCSQDEGQQKILSRLGYMMGKIIYYLDAAEDHEEDIVQNKYNVFSEYSRKEAAKAAAALCRLCAGDIALSYNLLNLKTNKQTLDNIIFLGIEQSVLNTGIKRRKEKINEN